MHSRWYLVGMVGILLASCVFTAHEVLAQNKDKNKDKKSAPKDSGNPATAADYAQIKSNVDLAGKLISLDAASKTLTLRVEFPHFEPNTNYKPPKGTNLQSSAQNREYQFWKTYQDLMHQQQLAMQAKSPQEQQRALNKFQTDMAKFQKQQMQLLQQAAKTNSGAAKSADNPKNQPFKVVTNSKDYSFEVQDDVVVRKMFLGTEYDDTGNLKEYSDKEKEDLRGKDKSKPGYEAKFEDVLQGQEVKLSMTVPKKKKEKEANTEDDPPAEAAPRPTVNMIVMTKDMGVSAIESSNPKKGKK